MWPWEHVAFGYLGYSLYRHVRIRTAPGDWATFAVVVAAAAPDLIDKPLSWTLRMFPTGYAVGHSIFTFLVVVLGAAGLRRRGHGAIGAAVVVGYGSHLLGDLVYPALLGEGLGFERLLWPLVTLPGYDEQLGLSGRTLLYVRRYLSRIAAGDVGAAIAIPLGLMVLVFGLWLYDGAPGIRLLWRWRGTTDRR